MSQAVLLIFGMIAIIYPIKSGLGGKAGLGLVLTIGFAGVVLLALFVQKQVRSDQPMLDSAAHVTLLHFAAASIVALAVLVYVLLTRYRPSESAVHSV